MKEKTRQRLIAEMRQTIVNYSKMDAIKWIEWRLEKHWFKNDEEKNNLIELKKQFEKEK